MPDVYVPDSGVPVFRVEAVETIKNWFWVLLIILACSMIVSAYGKRR